MKAFLIGILLLIFVSVKADQDGFLTIWAPKKVYDEKDYNVVVYPTNIDTRTEISLRFRKNYGTLALISNKLNKFKVGNHHKSGTKKEFDLVMTLHRNESTTSGERQMCMTQTLKKIEAENRLFHTYIQTDKPIYKPGDLVRFRVVVVDRDLKPYQMNSININVTDSLDHPIKAFDSYENYINFNGVISKQFKLSSYPPLGHWKIKVVVDKRNEHVVFKQFSVQKFILSHFSAHMTSNDKHLMINDVLHLSFYAKYSFGDFVRGNAEVRIRSINNGQIVATRSFRNISDAQNVQFNIQDVLKATTNTIKQDYEAELVFTEPESEISDKKIVTFTVHANNSPKIRVIHPENFMPGQPFSTKVFVYNWKDELIKNSSDRVYIKLDCRFQNETVLVKIKNDEINEGVVESSIDILSYMDELKVTVKYLNDTYERYIQKGSLIVGINQLDVDHFPKNPKYGSSVEIHTKSDSKLDELIGIVMSRHGMVETHMVYCQNQTTCKFVVTIRSDMMPAAKVMVYHRKDNNNIYQGETTIRTIDLGRNTIDIKIPTKTEPNRKVEMTIFTRPNSTVFLLGYDKSLSYLYQGNDIKTEDIYDELANLDASNLITMFQIKSENWHECTNQELRQLQLGRRYVVDHSGSSFLSNFHAVEDEDEDEEERELDQEPEDFRDDFREVWLFEELDVPDGELTKSFMIPDSMTSWMISSFSMNNEYGMAIGSPKELVVKNQFFIKVLLPYFVRFKEPFRVDILVHNYIDTSEPLNVTVSISGNDFVRFYETKCSKTPIGDTKLTKSVTVPHNNVKRVSFYMQAGNDRKELLQFAELKIDAIAQAKSGNVFNDKVIKKLKVDGPEVKKYEIEIKNYNLKSAGSVINDSISKNVTGIHEYPKLSVEISGDYMADELKDVKLGHEMTTSDPLYSRVEKLKGNVEHFRYLKSKTTNPRTKYFNDHYRSIFQYKSMYIYNTNNQGDRAYFMEAFASAIEINAISLTPSEIERQLDVIESHQNVDGTFSQFGTTIRSKSEYFRTAYMIIPFVKLRKFVTKNYDDVINKGFNYLYRNRFISASDKEAYSIAALAYALNNQHDEAQNMLNEVEKYVTRIDKNRRCFKLSRNDAKCDLRHTSYAAIAYLTLNRFSEAKALISYIHNEYKNIRNFSYNPNYGVATEALAKFLIAQPVYLPTNFTVTLTNEFDFKKVVDITAKNQKDSIEVVSPDYTLDLKMAIQGTGFCSIKKITEKSIVISKTSSKFILKVKVPASTTNTRIVQVCATYQPQEDDVSMQTLFNVIYDVEIPTGYVYKEVVDIESKPETWLSEPRLKGSRVLIYYKDFEREKEYCVDIKAVKIFDIKNTKYALVTVYEYSDKRNLAVDYFKFDDDCL